MQDNNEPELSGKKHETTDMNPKLALYFGVAMVVAAVIIHFSVLWMYRAFERRDSAETYRPSLVQPADQRPPEPRLQVQPRVDYAGHLKQQMDTLNSYGWVDQEAGTAHIPIDRAIQLLVEQQNAGRQGQ